MMFTSRDDAAHWRDNAHAAKLLDDHGVQAFSEVASCKAEQEVPLLREIARSPLYDTFPTDDVYCMDAHPLVAAASYGVST